MADSLKRRFERSLEVFKMQQSNERSKRNLNEQQQQNTSGSGKWNVVTNKRKWNAINSLTAIKLKMLIFNLSALLLLIVLPNCHQVRAGFFTFYFPNVLKPKGFSELTDMIHAVELEVNETYDNFADIKYFWGQLRQLDEVAQVTANDPYNYHEDSACQEVFPMFRELAIEYAHADFEHYIKPYELYRDHLREFRDRWYPGGLESKAALPREWEQKLLERELELKIEWLDRLIETERFRELRDRMTQIWKNVRRSLDTSLPCIYLRYAYRQISSDINQVALVGNLDSMKEAKKLLDSAYKRVEKYKESDQKIIEDIKEELMKIERFTIKA